MRYRNTLISAAVALYVTTAGAGTLVEYGGPCTTWATPGGAPTFSGHCTVSAGLVSSAPGAPIAYLIDTTGGAQIDIETDGWNCSFNGRACERIDAAPGMLFFRSDDGPAVHFPAPPLNSL